MDSCITTKKPTKPKEVTRENGYITVSEAAKIKNVTRQAIYLAIKLNRIKTFRMGATDTWHVCKEELEEYDETRWDRESKVVDGDLVYDELEGKISIARASRMLNISVGMLYYAHRRGWFPYSTKINHAIVLRFKDLAELKKNHYEFIKRNQMLKKKKESLQKDIFPKRRREYNEIITCLI